MRAADALPTIDELGVEGDETVCKVKLFMPAGRWTYYIAAVTHYDEQTVKRDLPPPDAARSATSPVGLCQVPRPGRGRTI